MDILSTLLFLFVWIVVWVIIMYSWAIFRYENKKNIDECYSQRSKLKMENESLVYKIKELKEIIKELNKKIENSKRELMEKNKYLSENIVVIERLFEVKQLSDKISDILLDYDKNTIQSLLNEYKHKKNKEDERDDKTEEEQNKKHW